MWARAAVLVVALLVTGLLVGCGIGSSSGGGTSAGTNCDQPSGVPGEIVIKQPMACETAASVARAYFKSGKAPGQWTSGAAKGWQCSGYPGQKHAPMAECTSFSTSARAQTELAQVFDIRRARD